TGSSPPVGYGVTMADSPTAGDPAPAFKLLNQSGDEVQLESLRGRKVLVFFYPKANTSGCTNQAVGLRDIAEEIGETEIIEISPDAPEKNASYDEKHQLGFTRLSDPEHETAEAYGAWGQKSMYGRSYMGIIRSAYLIDENGVVLAAWPKITPKDTPKKLLAALSDHS